MLSSLARWCATHRLLVILLWLALAAALLTTSRLVTGHAPEELTIPHSDSAAASAHLTPQSTDQSRSEMILTAKGAPSPEATRATVEAIEAIPGIAPITQPPQLSDDGRALRFPILLDPGTQPSKDLGEQVLAAAAPARDAHMDAVVGGALGRQLSGLNSTTSELIGIVAALLILLLAFGSAVAALLPIVTAAVVVAGGTAALDLLASRVSIPDVAPTLATMIGLGVGVDYTLFLVSRQRKLLTEGATPLDAVAATARSAGAAVVFAGATVVVAICGLVLTGVDFVSWLGWSSALLVAGAVLSAVTLTPAVLAVAGGRLRKGRRVPVSEGDLDRTAWGRFGDWATRRPVAVAATSAVVLLALGAPTLGLVLGQSDGGDRAPGRQVRMHYEALAAGWGPGEIGPLSVVLTDPGRAGAAAAALDATDGVHEVSPPRPLPSGAVVLRVVPETAPSDPGTAALVTRLRDEVLPPFGEAHVGGGTATRTDLANRITERLPWLVLAVIGVACLLLLLAFRSVVLPLKAALMNLVSLCAAYGAVTAVFQWGWGASLIGLDGPVPIDSYVPMVLFAVLFGLSMDYEVFLLTAVQEHWHRTGDNRAAVRRGLAETGGVITSAALIMVCVFGSFVLVDNPSVKIFGLGLSTAIVVDATIVRCLLVPATMVVLGRWNWWLPRWLDRLLPHVFDHRPAAPAAQPVSLPVR